MKFSARFATLLLLIPCIAAAQAVATALQPIPWPAPAGSVQLWNGQDLTGWTPYFKDGIVPPPGFWSAAGSVLHLAGKPTGYLRTDKSFANYHLHTEWRWLAKAKSGINNSGIFVTQHPPDVVWPYSVQVQLKAQCAGDLISQGGLFFPAGKSNPTIKKMADANEKPDGEWNGADIYCRGASIEVFINGLRQNFVDQLPSGSGQIALQVEGYPVEFRNIWLEQLQPARN
jgi:hypothetical protein